MKREVWILFLSSVGIFLSTMAKAGLHNVPIVIPAKQIHAVQFHPLAKYRVFRTDPDGSAVIIPFQIDQKDKYGDYILDQGKHPTAKFSNGIFSNQDELCVMGNDVGMRQPPTKWSMKKPNILYEVGFKRGGKEGAIYVGVYFTDPPPLAKESYVSFDLENAQVTTSRYRYLFNNQNYLVVRGVNIEQPGKKEDQIILSSSVFLKIDMKYFLTFNVGDSDIESDLDAYKVGPVRAITRVNFDYKILKLKFDLGMYTEVSFFSNAVYLPAIIDNPLDGKKALNGGSYFYYGLALTENPANLNVAANMPAIDNKDAKINDNESRLGHYWATARAKNYMLYLEFQPSKQMSEDKNIPYMYVENVNSEELKKRKRLPLPLGKSPVNVAVSFDLDNFRAGLHEVRFRLFVENLLEERFIDEFKTVDQWYISARRLASIAF